MIIFFPGVADDLPPFCPFWKKKRKEQSSLLRSHISQFADRKVKTKGYTLEWVHSIQYVVQSCEILICHNVSRWQLSSVNALSLKQRLLIVWKPSPGIPRLYFITNFHLCASCLTFQSKCVPNSYKKKFHKLIGDSEVWKMLIFLKNIAYN